MGGSDDHVLDLGLSLIKTPTHNQLKKQPPTSTARGSCYEPSLTLSLSGGETTSFKTTTPPNKINHPPSSTPFDNNKLVCRTTTAAEEAANSTSTQLASPQYCNSASAVSSVSYNMTSHVKRERETTVSDEAEVEKVGSRGGGGGGGVGGGGGSSDVDEEEEGNTRKKLRLTKDQSALLEESFKLHSTLNPKQKQALANQLNLRPRQVEVWFQNRRARTKLKQTEVDCEFLRKCCETLTEDNRRLQKELQELKAIKLAQPPFYMHLPAATLTMCPSCERVGTGGGVGGGTTGHVVGNAGTNSKLPFNTNATKSPHHHHHHNHQFYNSYTNPSAAC